MIDQELEAIRIRTEEQASQMPTPEYPGATQAGQDVGRAVAAALEPVGEGALERSRGKAEASRLVLDFFRGLFNPGASIPRPRTPATPTPRPDPARKPAPGPTSRATPKQPAKRQTAAVRRPNAYEPNLLNT